MFIRSELIKVINKSVKITIVAVVVLIVIAYSIKDTYVLYRNIDIWTNLGQYFGLLYVLIAIAPVSWVMVYERRNSYIFYTLPRVSKRKYLITKWGINACISFFIIFFISVSTLVIIMYLFPDVVIEGPIEDDTAKIHYYKGDYYVKYPFYYGLILSAWRGFLAFLYSTLAFVISLFVKNIFVVNAIPFLFDIFNSFVLGTLGLTGYEIMTSFDPSRVSAESVSIYTFLVSMITIMVLIIFTIMYFKIIKKEKVYKI